jgi:hypothetical protein
MFETGSAEIGRPMRAPSGRKADLERGMVFAGGPEQIAARIVHLHKLLGHSRQILQMDVGGMPHQTFLKSIELLDKKVLPKVREQMATDIATRSVITLRFNVRAGTSDSPGQTERPKADAILRNAGATACHGENHAHAVTI